MITSIGVRQESHLTVRKIIKVVPKYVVIDTDIGIREEIKTVNVYRLENPRMFDLGTVRLLKYHDGKAVARIIDENRGYQIKVGDYVYLQYKSLREMSVGEYMKFIEKNGIKKDKSDS